MTKKSVAELLDLIVATFMTGVPSCCWMLAIPRAQRRLGFPIGKRAIHERYLNETS